VTGRHFPLGGQHIRQAVFIGAGQEPRIVATKPVVAGQHIGLHEFEREASMRRGVDVGNSGGDVERSHVMPPPGVVGP
jgi:hypothetical protein